jgi:hypothetical protein
MTSARCIIGMKMACVLSGSGSYDRCASELKILPTLQRTGLHRLYFFRRPCYNCCKLSKAVAASIYYLSLACM